MAMPRGWLWLGLGTACVAAVSIAYQASVPHIGQATKAQVLALIPKDLREAPPDDPAAEARLLAVLRLAREKGDPADRLRALLDAGPLQAPETPLVQPGIDRRLGFPKIEASLLESILKATKEGDRGRCADRSILTFRLIDALRRAGGDSFEADVVSIMLGKASMTVCVAARRGGYDAEGRRRVLAALPRNDGSDLADAVGVDFRNSTLPDLVRAATTPDGIVEVFSDFTEYKKIDVGTYDPLETTRLAVAFAQEDRKVCRRTRAALDPALVARAQGMLRDLPSDPATPSLWSRVRWRWSMNHGVNTLGRTWIVPRRLNPSSDERDRREKTLRPLRAALR